jgi:hypothetical protein
MIPQTDFILVRGPRTDSTDNPIEIVVSIQRNNGKFDFSDYSFLRMRPDAKDPMEEWVPTKELDLYKKSFGVEE